MLSGPGGVGKSTALAQWLGHRDGPVMARFVGASDTSTSVDALLASLVREATGRERGPARLRDTWHTLVRGVVVLDAWIGSTTD